MYPNTLFIRAEELFSRLNEFIYSMCIHALIFFPSCSAVSTMPLIHINSQCPYRDRFYLYELRLIAACISNNVHYNVWDEITYPIPDFNDAAIPHNAGHVVTYSKF